MLSDLHKSTVINDQAWADLVKLCSAGGVGLLNELVDSFMIESTEIMERLKKAAKTSDTRALAVLAGELKASAAGVGADSLSRLCAEVEAMARKKRTPGSNDQVTLIESGLSEVHQEITRRLEQAIKTSAA